MRHGTCLKKLDLLVLGQQELAGFAPMRRMLPPMFDEATGVSVNLYNAGRKKVLSNSYDNGRALTDL